MSASDGDPAFASSYLQPPSGDSSATPTPTPTPPNTLAPTPSRSTRSLAVSPGASATPTNRPTTPNNASSSYLNALAAAAQASLQSAPSSPGGDLPISRSRSGQRHPEKYPDRQTSGSPPGNRTSFLDIDSATPVSTPGSSIAGDPDQDLYEPYEPGLGTAPVQSEDGGVGVNADGGAGMGAGGTSGGPVGGGSTERATGRTARVGEGPGYGGYIDPLARARAGVSVAKGEGLVEQLRPLLDKHRKWSEQDLPEAVRERMAHGGPVQGYQDMPDQK